MTRTLRAVLVTLGDPRRLTGGYLFHRRLAELAPRARRPAGVRVVSRAPVSAGRRSTRPRHARTAQALRRRGRSCSTASPPPSSGPGCRCAPRCRWSACCTSRPAASTMVRCARRCRPAWIGWPTGSCGRLLVASESLADELRAPGVPRRAHQGRAARARRGRRGGPAAGDLRQGRRAAFLCVGNWVERKGILSLLEAFAALDADAATLHLVGDTARRAGVRAARPRAAGSA